MTGLSKTFGIAVRNFTAYPEMPGMASKRKPSASSMIACARRDSKSAGGQLVTTRLSDFSGVSFVCWPGPQRQHDPKTI